HPDAMISKRSQKQQRFSQPPYIIHNTGPPQGKPIYPSLSQNPVVPFVEGVYAHLQHEQ
ncbi:unnamed protein product, partial [Adineta steineri]